jgi:hypothetical protein
LTLTFNDTSFPSSRVGLTLDELWLTGASKGTLKSTSGAALDPYSGFYHRGVATENGKYNWEADFKDGAFREGQTSTLTIKGAGITVESLFKKAPMIELAGVGAPYAGFRQLCTSSGPSCPSHRPMR